MNFLRLSDSNSILSVLYSFNTLFHPALSQRRLNLKKYSDKLARNATVYVAQDTEILGFIAFYSNDKKSRMAYLILIAVKPEMMGKKLAQKLLCLCIKNSKSKGMLTLKVEVRTNNDRAINFYKKNGFLFCGKASFDSMYMIRNL